MNAEEKRDPIIYLFSLRNKFKKASGGCMSRLYEIGTKKRYDWDLVETALDEGSIVMISQATPSELLWAKELAKESLQNKLEVERTEAKSK